MSNIFKVNNKGTKTIPIFNLGHVYIYSTVITAEFGQLCWLGLRNFSFRQ